MKLKEKKLGYYCNHSIGRNEFQDLSGNAELSSVGSLRSHFRDQDLSVIYLDEHQKSIKAGMWQKDKIKVGCKNYQITMAKLRLHPTRIL